MTEIGAPEWSARQRVRHHRRSTSTAPVCPSTPGRPSSTNMLCAAGQPCQFLTTIRRGDVEIEGHHRRDTAIVLGTALGQALGDRKGIRRFGDAFIPMDDAGACRGRRFRTAVLRTTPANRITWWTSPSRVRGAVPHRDQPARLRVAGRQRPDRPACAHLYGRDPHHITEAQYKAVARRCGRPSSRTRGRRAYRPPKAFCDIGCRPDYGSGNLRIGPACAGAGRGRRAGDLDATVALAADGLVVPGVGAFEACMSG